mgnify:CR=1 FL=1
MLACGANVVGAGSGVELEGVAVIRPDWIPETGRDLELVLFGVVVTNRTGDDRLECDAKLDSVDFELSVRTGNCLAGFVLAGIW